MSVLVQVMLAILLMGEGVLVLGRSFPTNRDVTSNGSGSGSGQFDRSNRAELDFKRRGGDLGRLQATRRRIVGRDEERRLLREMSTRTHGRALVPRTSGTTFAAYDDTTVTSARSYAVFHNGWDNAYNDVSWTCLPCRARHLLHSTCSAPLLGHPVVSLNAPANS